SALTSILTKWRSFSLFGYKICFRWNTDHIYFQWGSNLQVRSGSTDFQKKTIAAYYNNGPLLLI
ncbi:MAG: hypothetical protein WBP83_08455, partial [Nitrososphaeraceae archaeon]